LEPARKSERVEDQLEVYGGESAEKIPLQKCGIHQVKELEGLEDEMMMMQCHDRFEKIFHKALHPENVPEMMRNLELPELPHWDWAEDPAVRRKIGTPQRHEGAYGRRQRSGTSLPPPLG
jgi:hypothetical protein